jgi:hypothetical protein
MAGVQGEVSVLLRAATIYLKFLLLISQEECDETRTFRAYFSAFGSLGPQLILYLG